MNTSDSMVFVLSYHIQGKQHLHQLQQEGVLCVWWKKRQKYRKYTNSYLISEVIVMALSSVTVLQLLLYYCFGMHETWNLNLSPFFKPCMSTLDSNLSPLAKPVGNFWATLWTWYSNQGHHLLHCVSILGCRVDMGLKLESLVKNQWANLNYKHA